MQKRAYISQFILIFLIPNLAYADHVDELIHQLLYGQTYQDRIDAAEALGGTKDPRSITPLIETLIQTLDIIGYYAYPAYPRPNNYSDPELYHFLRSIGFALGEIGNYLPLLLQKYNFYLIKGQIFDIAGHPFRFTPIKIKFPFIYSWIGGGSNWTGTPVWIHGGEIFTITDNEGIFFLLLPQTWIKGKILKREDVGWSLEIQGKEIKVTDGGLTKMNGIEIILNLNGSTSINPLKSSDVDLIYRLANNAEFIKFCNLLHLDGDAILGGLGILKTIFENHYLKELVELDIKYGYLNPNQKNFWTYSPFAENNWSYMWKYLDVLLENILSQNEENIRDLIQFLNKSDISEDERKYVSLSLILIGEPVIKPLQEFIKSGEGSEEAIRWAKYALQELGAEIPEAVVKQPEEPQTPSKTVQPQEKSVEELLTELKSEDKQVVINAIAQVKENNMVEAVEPLLVLLGNLDKEIRDNTLEALVQLKDSVEDEALKELVNYAVIIASPDVTKEEKINAIQALGSLKDVRGVDVLARTLADEDMDIKFEAMKVIIEIWIHLLISSLSS